MTTKQNCRVKSSQGDTKEVSRFHQHFVPHEESSHGESCHYDFWKALRHHDKEQGRGGRGCPRWHGLPVSVLWIQDPALECSDLLNKDSKVVERPQQTLMRVTVRNQDQQWGHWCSHWDARPPVREAVHSRITNPVQCCHSKTPAVFLLSEFLTMAR